MQTPHFSVNEGMTPGLTFAEDLGMLRAAGIEGIGIAAGLVGYGRPKLRDDVEDLARFRESGLRAGFCNPSPPSILPRRTDVAGALGEGAAEPDARVERMSADIRRLAPFEPICCICVPGPLGAYEPARAREICVDALRKLARVAADVGVTLAIEPMHTSIATEFSFVNTVPDALALLDDVGEPNTGIVVDVWHVWDTPDLLVHLRRNAGRVIGVHVDDWRDPTRGWCDRVLPGDGVADLDGILRALIEGGYDGWYELEVLSDDGTFGNDYADSLWKRDPQELVEAGRRQFLNAWTAAAAAVDG